MTTPHPDSGTHLTRLFGGPGSGKTTALLDHVEEILEQDDVDVKDLLVVSYTRAAAAEIRERLAERLDISPRTLQGNVSTMHAKAYELLNLSRNDVVGEKDKKEFCEGYGLEFEDEYSGSRRRSARSTTLGNKIIATTQWLQRTQRDVSDWYDVPFQWNDEEVRLPPEIDEHSMDGNKYTPTWPSDDDRVDVPEAIRAWKAYKGENDLVGFADMLERVKQRALLPNVDYLVIDEFQDISRLQFSVYQEWKSHMDQVLIAGDDDQVVYAWQGADPQLLLEETGDDDIILDTSYRLPSDILDIVQQEIEHIDQRQDKNLSPRVEGGTVEGIESPSILDLVRNVRHTVQNHDDSIMILFRARYQMFQFVEEFIDEGIPFQALTDQRMWTDRFTQYVDAVKQIESDEPIDGQQAKRLANMLMDSAFGSSERDELYDALDERKEAEDADHYADLEIEPELISNHVPFMPDTKSAADMVRKVTNFQKNSLRAYVKNEQYHDMETDQVRVGTIHSAKGREADHVIVATDLTEKVVEQMAATVSSKVKDDESTAFEAENGAAPMLTDNERRVFFVGMSRARKRLVLLENLITGAPTLSIDVLLNNEETGESIESLLSMSEPITH